MSVDADNASTDSEPTSYNVNSDKAHEVRAAFQERIGEPLTTSELADSTGFSQDVARYHANGLAGAGLLRKKSVGSRATVYWRPSDDDLDGWSPSVEAAIRELRIHGRGGPVDMSRAAWDDVVYPTLKDSEGFSTHLNPVIYSPQYDDDGEPVDPREGVDDAGTLAVIDYLSGVHSLAGANWTNQGTQKKVLWPAMKEELLSHPDVYQTPRGALLWSGRGLPPAELPRHMKG